MSGDKDVWVYRLALWEAGWLCNRTIVVQRGLSGEYINIGLGARYIKDCAQLQHATNPIATIIQSMRLRQLFFQANQGKVHEMLTKERRLYL